MLRVSQGQLDAGNFAPKTVIAGEFQIFAKNSKVQICAAADAVDNKDFLGKYQLSSGRKLSVLEESLVPKLQEWYIIPEQVVSICKHAQITTGKPV